MCDCDQHRYVPPPIKRTKETLVTDRLSPSQELLRYFAYAHLPEALKGISRNCASLADSMESVLPDGPEKTMGLRKLLEAKDCFVRAALPPEEA